MTSTVHAIDQAIAEHCKAEGLADKAVGWVVLLPTINRDGETVRTGVLVVHAEQVGAPFVEAVIDSARDRTPAESHAA